MWRYTIIQDTIHFYSITERVPYTFNNFPQQCTTMIYDALRRHLDAQTDRWPLASPFNLKPVLYTLVRITSQYNPKP